MLPRNRQRQTRLLPENARWTKRGPAGDGRTFEICPGWNEVSAGLSIGEDNVLVSSVYLRQRRQQTAQVDLRAANPTGNQIQRIHADSEGADVLSRRSVPVIRRTCSQIAGSAHCGRYSRSRGYSSRAKPVATVVAASSPTPVDHAVARTSAVSVRLSRNASATSQSFAAHSPAITRRGV